MKEKLMEEITKRSAENKISCPALRAIAEDAGVSYVEAGKAADMLGIKITDCGLGCF